MSYANIKGADQPAHPHSLISAFAVRCLDNIIPILVISKMLSLYLTSVAEQVSLILPGRTAPTTGFLMTCLNCD